MAVAPPGALQPSTQESCEEPMRRGHLATIGVLLVIASLLFPTSVAAADSETKAFVRPQHIGKLDLSKLPSLRDKTKPRSSSSS